MRLIDADALLEDVRKNSESYFADDFAKYWVDQQPTIDAVEVVRCRECKYRSKGENESASWNLCGYRPWLHFPTSNDHFCGYGERGEADGN